MRHARIICTFAKMCKFTNIFTDNMKKSIIVIAASAIVTLGGCGFTGGTATGSSTSSASKGSVLGSVLGSATNTGTLSNILYSVIGLDKLSASDLIGTWKYYQPGCAFTSESLLAKAGGEVAATRAKEELSTTYGKLGISSSNTYFTFSENGSFSGKLNGKSISGTYTFNNSDQSIQLKTLLFSIKGYVNRNSKGISLLFESKKLLTALQVVASMSGNSTLSTVGELSKNYDGIRMGFDLKR